MPEVGEVFQRRHRQQLDPHQPEVCGIKQSSEDDEQEDLERPTADLGDGSPDAALDRPLADASGGYQPPEQSLDLLRDFNEPNTKVDRRHLGNQICYFLSISPVSGRSESSTAVQLREGCDYL